MTAQSIAEERFAAAMNGARFGPAQARPLATKPTLQPVSAPAKRQRPATEFHLGDADAGGEIGLDLTKLLDGRLLVQGTSGAGKSWTLRRVIEQTHGAIQQIVVDPEGEFGSLSEALGLLKVEAHQLDPAALVRLAAAAREHRTSLVLDLSEQDREDQMKSVAAFFGALIDAPRDHWYPCLVAVDEAHLFAPFGGQTSAATSVRRAAISAVIDLMSRGRKRGLCGVLATQRLARLAKSVASEVHNFVIGLNTLDLDIRRAAETVGWDVRRAFDRLPMLSPGDFVAVGPAFSTSPCVLRVGPVRTAHRGATPVLAAPAPISADDAARLLGLADLIEASAADEAVREDGMVPGLKAVRAFLREEAFPAAGKVWAALAPLVPEGAAMGELAAHLGMTADELAAALALLDRFGAVEFSDTDAGRAVRIAPEMKP